MEQAFIQQAFGQIMELPQEDLELLLPCATRREVPKGTQLLREGELCRSFFLVENGHLRTYYNKEGVPINLHFSFEKEFASNLKSFKSREPSDIVIEAGEKSVVWIFDFDLIKANLNSNPQITLFFRRLAVRLLLASEEYSNLFKIYTPTERYHYIETNNPQLLQRISLSQMASYLGVTRETLSRIRGKNR